MAQNSFAGMFGAPRKNSLGTSLADLYFNAPAPPPGLKAYHPTLGEKAQTGLANVLGRLGVGQHQANHLAERTLGALNALTPLGSATAASDAKRDYSQGNYLGAAANSLSALLGIVPDGGATVGKGLGAVLHSIIAPLYHGSPHKFEKFALEKIGTGEGAQAYGRGLYFAESPAVAREYRAALSGPSNYVPLKKTEAHDTMGALLSDNWSWAGAMGEAHDRLEREAKTVDEMLSVAPHDKGLKAWRERINQHAADLRKVQPADFQQYHPGHVYQVQLNADPPHFLDYDAPLVNQPAAMEVLKNLDLSKTGAMSRTRKMLEWARDGQELPEYQAKGHELLNALSNYGENSGAEVAPLAAQGLKGIRYLDQGSRGTGQGTRNYVVFDPNIIDILSRN